MKIMLTAIETMGTINANHQIELDEKLPNNTPRRVRVIVLFNEDADIEEKEWMQAASGNEVFDFLDDRSEDIYTLEDGKPLNTEK